MAQISYFGVRHGLLLAKILINVFSLQGGVRLIDWVKLIIEFTEPSCFALPGCRRTPKPRAGVRDNK